MKTLTRSIHCALLSVCLYSLAGTIACADEIVSLDDPAPSASAAPPLQILNSAAGSSALESLDGSAAMSGAEKSIDLDAGEKEGSSFNPYLFSRDILWMLLPLLSLILLGLHLLPIPKRAVVKKIDQAQRFFRMNDQDKTGMIQRPTSAQLAQNPVTTAGNVKTPKKGNLNVDDGVLVEEEKTRVIGSPTPRPEKSPQSRQTSSKIFVPQGEED